MYTQSNLSDPELLNNLFKQIDPNYQLNDDLLESNLITVLSKPYLDDQICHNDHQKQLWQAVRQIYQRGNEETFQFKGKIQSVNDIDKLLNNYFHDLHNEQFIAVALDSSGHILDQNVFNIGTHNAMTVSINEICKWTLNTNADSILVAHNHPNENATPSKEDIKTSQDLQKALNLFDVSLFDSQIITKKKHTSLAKMQLIN